jgi:glutaredoxin 3
MASVTLYTSPTCPHCKNLKKYLHDKGVAYTDNNVMASEVKRAELMELSGQMAVPVIVVKDGSQEDVIIGFDQAEIDKVLKL